MGEGSVGDSYKGEVGDSYQYIPFSSTDHFTQDSRHHYSPDQRPLPSMSQLRPRSLHSTPGFHSMSDPLNPMLSARAEPALDWKSSGYTTEDQDIYSMDYRELSDTSMGILVDPPLYPEDTSRQHLCLASRPNQQLSMASRPNQQLSMTSRPNQQLSMASRPNQQLSMASRPNQQLSMTSRPNQQLSMAGRSGQRRHSTPATLIWLDQHYHLSDGVCLPRNSVYFNYVDFCSKNSMTPVNAASFGKIIRQMFPNLTTRRLGTRGQSRYHYYGLAVKENSPYYNPAQSRKEAFPHTSSESRTGGNDSSSGPGGGSGHASPPNVLPEFPRTRDLHLPDSVPADRLNTLIAMYRVHSQHLFEAIIRYNVLEISHMMTYFWSSIPAHLSSMLSSTLVVSILGMCDTILYRATIKAILPNPTQTFSEGLRKMIRKFCYDFCDNIKVALGSQPEILRVVKIKLGSQFTRLLLRRTSVNHLVAAAGTMMIAACGGRMGQDWNRLQPQTVADEVAAKHHLAPPEVVRTLMGEWSSLLESGRRLEEVCVWTVAVVDRLVARNTAVTSVPAAARMLLRAWTAFSSRMLQCSKSLKVSTDGELGVLQLLLNELVLHEVERLLAEETGRELMINIIHDTPPDFSGITFIESLPVDFCSRAEASRETKWEEDKRVPSPDSTQNHPNDSQDSKSNLPVNLSESYLSEGSGSSGPSGQSGTNGQGGPYCWHQPGNNQEYQEQDTLLSYSE